MSSAAATTLVFALPELLENILLHLTSFGKPAPWVIRELFRLRRVNRAFTAVMAASPHLRRVMFLHDGTTRSGQPERLGKFNPFLLAQTGSIFHPCTFVMSGQIPRGVQTRLGRELSIRTTPHWKWAGKADRGKLALQQVSSWREMRVMDGDPKAVVMVRLFVEGASGSEDAGREEFELAATQTLGDLVWRVLEEMRSVAYYGHTSSGNCKNSNEHWLRRAQPQQSTDDSDQHYRLREEARKTGWLFGPSRLCDS